MRIAALRDRGCELSRKSSLAMGILAIVLLGLPDPSAARPLVTPAAALQELMPVKMQRLILDPTSGQPVVFLTDVQEERALPIWIGPCEANAMNAEMEGAKHPRPQTHDLLDGVIRKMKAKVQKVIVTHSKDGVYYATLVLEREGAAVEIDARPSDSLVLALKAKAPIFVGKKMFEEMSVPLKEAKGSEEPYGLTAQDLTPSLARSFGHSSGQGVLISDVRPGSAAEKDGLQRGDIVVELGGEPISDLKALRAGLNKAQGAVKARVFRKGENISLTVHGK